MTKDQIKVEAKKFTEEHSIIAGWSQEQHVGFVYNLIIAEIGVEGVEEKAALLAILTQTCNPSAFRQTLESAGILAKTEKGKRANVLANKYAKVA